MRAADNRRVIAIPGLVIGDVAGAFLERPVTGKALFIAVELFVVAIRDLGRRPGVVPDADFTN